MLGFSWIYGEEKHAAERQLYTMCLCSVTLKALGCVCLVWQRHYKAVKQQQHSEILFVLFVLV